MHQCSSVYSERGVPLPVLTSGGEWVGVRACKNATRVPPSLITNNTPIVIQKKNEPLISFPPSLRLKEPQTKLTSLKPLERLQEISWQDFWRSHAPRGASIMLFVKFPPWGRENNPEFGLLQKKHVPFWGLFWPNKSTKSTKNEE